MIAELIMTGNISLSCQSHYRQHLIHVVVRLSQMPALTRVALDSSKHSLIPGRPNMLPIPRLCRWQDMSRNPHQKKRQEGSLIGSFAELSEYPRGFRVMDKIEIGLNAGIVWRLLSVKGKMAAEELRLASGLHPFELALAVGWLARENKIDMMVENGTEYYSTFQEFYY